MRFKYHVLLLMSIVCVCGHVNYNRLPEGARCVDDNLEGTCLRYQHCARADPWFNERRKPLKICSYQGYEDIVCCTDHRALHSNYQQLYSESNPVQEFNNAFGLSNYYHQARKHQAVDLQQPHSNHGLVQASNQAYSQGYSQGSIHGYHQGYSHGTSQGFIQGTSQGYNQGISHGTNQGYSQGFSHGTSLGYSQGLVHGTNLGLSLLSNQRLSQGIAQGPSPGPIQGPIQGFGLSQVPSPTSTPRPIQGAGFSQSQIPRPGVTRRPIQGASQSAIVSQALVQGRQGRIADQKCAEFIQTLPFPFDPRGVENELNTTPMVPVIGGRDAERDEFPHMALLGYGNNLDSARYLCAGSVISERYILTAGHCLSIEQLAVRYIALGIQRRSDEPALWQRYLVSKTVPHPEYRPPIKYNDLALLQTSEQIQFSESVLPACLYTGTGDTSTALASGWGSVGNQPSLSDILQVVPLMQFSDQVCVQRFPPDDNRNLLQGYDSRSQLCYGDNVGLKDTCFGDSGGPLQIRSSLSSRVYLILGVTSFGATCGFQGNPGIYTKITNYLPWIEGEVFPQ